MAERRSGQMTMEIASDLFDSQNRILWAMLALHPEKTAEDLENEAIYSDDPYHAGGLEGIADRMRDAGHATLGDYLASVKKLRKSRG